MTRDTIVRVKMKDVAKAAGVSPMTVSRALKHDGRVAPSTRGRVLEAVQELGYVPDRLAGALSAKRSGFIGVLVPSLNNPHFAETAAGLQGILMPAGLQLLLGYTNYRPEIAERLIETMLERRPEAMVVTYDDHTERARHLLSKAGIPIIEIWERPRKPIEHVVGFSNRVAARAMTRHIIDTGRRKIGFIGEDRDDGTRGSERRKGFLDAMRAAGLDASRRVAFGAPPINMLGGRAAMNELLTKWPDTDSVFCVSDPAAFGALTACKLAGLEVPDRIAIAGFGDFEISRCALPAITTVVVSGFEIGMRTGELIVRLLGTGSQKPELIMLTTLPEARESTSTRIIHQA